MMVDSLFSKKKITFILVCMIASTITVQQFKIIRYIVVYLPIL